MRDRPDLRFVWLVGSILPLGEASGSYTGRKTVVRLVPPIFLRTSAILSRYDHSPPPVPFVGDFAFFGSTEAPFSAKVTDTAGEVSVLEKALYCTTGQFSVPNNKNTSFVTYGDVEVNTIRFKSSLDVIVGGTSSTSIPPSKLRTVSVGKVDNASGRGGYLAKAILRTGESVGLTIVPSNGIYVPNGIVGASSKGWVWIPWYAVASVEFDDKQQFRKLAASEATPGSAAWYKACVGENSE